MYKSKITIDNDAESLELLFKSEQKDLGRSSFKVNRKGNLLNIDVTAEDAVAFKTVMNTLAKIFAVWEGTKRIPRG